MTQTDGTWLALAAAATLAGAATMRRGGSRATPTWRRRGEIYVATAGDDKLLVVFRRVSWSGVVISREGELLERRRGYSSTPGAVMESMDALVTPGPPLPPDSTLDRIVWDAYGLHLTPREVPPSPELLASRLPTEWTRAASIETYDGTPYDNAAGRQTKATTVLVPHLLSLTDKYWAEAPWRGRWSVRARSHKRYGPLRLTEVARFSTREKAEAFIQDILHFSGREYELRLYEDGQAVATSGGHPSTVLPVLRLPDKPSGRTFSREP